MDNDKDFIAGASAAMIGIVLIMALIACMGVGIYYLAV